MPLLIGLDEDQAREAAEQVGIEIGSVITIASSEEAGKVIYQSIKAYTDVDPDAVVYLQVSDGSYSSGQHEEEQSEEEEQEQEQEEVTQQKELPAVQDASLQEPETPETVYQVTVPVSEDVLTEEMLSAVEEGEDVSDVTVTVTVNGETIMNLSCPISAKQVSSVYQGEIDDIVVMINGVQTKNFDCVNISQ
jgi:beta-lactam-binding protein with PASTA domain